MYINLLTIVLSPKIPEYECFNLEKYENEDGQGSTETLLEERQIGLYVYRHFINIHLYKLNIPEFIPNNKQEKLAHTISSRIADYR